MATEQSAGAGFGEVSRVRGVVFRYVLLVATLSALVSLGVLLANVTLDAIRPASADPAWYLTYLVVFVVPSTLAGLYLYAHSREALTVGIEALFVPVAGLFGGGALLLLFEAILFNVWFAWALGVAVVVSVYFLVFDFDLRTRAIAVVGVGWVALFGLPVPGLSGLPGGELLALGVPAFVQFHVRTIPNPYLTYLLTLALPVAGFFARRIRQHEKNQQAGLLAGGFVFVLALSVVFQTVLAPEIALILVLTVAVPSVYYVAITIRDRQKARIGLLLPAVVATGVLVGSVLVWLFGFSGPNAWLNLQLLTGTPTGVADTTGLNPALVGSLLLMIVVIASAFPVGVGAAVYLEEYAPANRYTRFIQLNISNLAGVPSVVYGLLGLGLFIDLGGLSGQTVSIAGQTITLSGLPTGSLLAGGLAISLLILPIVIISSQEAIRSVPDSLKQASFGMGATQWQTVKNVVLPRAIPGVLTGTILAVGRAVGETAPLIMVLAADFKTSPPSSLFDKTSALPLQVYHWAFKPDAAFRHGVLAAGVVTMIVVLLSINSIAIILRNKYDTD